MASAMPETMFSPFQVGSIVLPTRFVMPGMQRGWCTDGRLAPTMVDYYAARARGGVGLVIGEACAVDHWSSTWSGDFPRLNPDTLDEWRACAHAVGRAGAHMILQLSHPGAIRTESQALPRLPGPALSPSGIYKHGHANGRAATVAELGEIRDAFATAARHARDAGLAGVELHGCHGFLLDQFLWAETNLRDDRYGGAAIEDRARFPAEVVAAVREATGPDFLISFRLSQWKEVDYAARIVDTPEELGRLLAVLRAAGVDLFHASTRRFYDAEWPGSDLGLAGWMKRLTDAPVLAVGSVGMATDVMETLVGSAGTGLPLDRNIAALCARFDRGDFDLVAVGRALIGDPRWVQKVRADDLAAIRPFDKADLAEAIAMEPVLIEQLHTPPPISVYTID